MRCLKKLIPLLLLPALLARADGPMPIPTAPPPSTRPQQWNMAALRDLLVKAAYANPERRGEKFYVQEHLGQLGQREIGFATAPGSIVVSLDCGEMPPPEKLPPAVAEQLLAANSQKSSGRFLIADEGTDQPHRLLLVATQTLRGIQHEDVNIFLAVSQLTFMANTHADLLDTAKFNQAIITSAPSSPTTAPSSSSITPENLAASLTAAGGTDLKDFGQNTLTLRISVGQTTSPALIQLSTHHDWLLCTLRLGTLPPNAPPPPERLMKLMQLNNLIRPCSFSFQLSPANQYELILARAIPTSGADVAAIKAGFDQLALVLTRTAPDWNIATWSAQPTTAASP